jgi:hypothetical protein
VKRDFEEVKMEMISPQQVGEILKAHGTHVSEEEAKIILEFMINLAKISLSQLFQGEKVKRFKSG